MGRPAGSLTQAQIAQLQTAGAMAPAEQRHLNNGGLRITVLAQGIALLEVSK